MDDSASLDASEPMGLRKIIHVDMDAFYASVEQRDNPELKGKPVVVGGSAERGVVAAASYEARRFGVRSAMASSLARRLCPDLVFVRPRFTAYRAVSQQIRAIFEGYTPLVEPLALDEAYLDVTDDLRGIGSATRIAELIRERIRTDTGLTASAGVVSMAAEIRSKRESRFITASVGKLLSGEETRTKHQVKPPSSMIRSSRHPHDIGYR